MTKYRGHSIEHCPGGRHGDWLVHTYGCWGYYFFHTVEEAKAFINGLYGCCEGCAQ